MELKIVSKQNEFLELKDRWNALIEDIDEPQIFYRWEWVNEYLENIDINCYDQLRIVVAYEKSKIIAIVPFLQNNKVLRFITNKTVDYNNIYIHKMYNKYTVLEKVLDYFFDNEKFEEIILENFQGSSELYIICDIVRNKFNCKAIVEDSVMVPKLIYNTDNSLKFRKKQLKDIERRKRKLENENRVDISIGTKMDEGTWKFLNENHKKKWSRSVFYNDEYVCFYLALISKMKDNIEVSKLEVNGEIAAVHFGFKDNNKVYYYIPIYDEKYSQNGVGYILLKDMIEYYREKKEFDFLRGNENYKFNWCDNIGMNFNLYIYKPSVTNKIKALVMQTKIYLKKSKTLRKIFNK